MEFEEPEEPFAGGSTAASLTAPPATGPEIKPGGIEQRSWELIAAGSNVFEGGAGSA